MRRFSQRSSLVTLSEINITPLLDLAFVLLIIFVITTPLLEQSINLKLNNGGGPAPQINRRDVRTVEINTQGSYVFERQPMRLERIEAELQRDAHSNPNLVVRIRVDRDSPTKYFYAVLDFCQHNGIKMSLATEGERR
jgi:biopolymer transport protein ExbD